MVYYAWIYFQENLGRFSVISGGGPKNFGRFFGRFRGWVRTPLFHSTITNYTSLRRLFLGSAVRSRAIAENHACVPCIARAYRDRESKWRGG